MKTRAFSLVEILVVISIVAVLITTVVVVGGRAREAARHQQAVATVDALAGMLDEYSVARMRGHAGRPNAYPNIGPASSVMDTESIAVECEKIETAQKQLDGFAKITDALPSGDVVDYHGATVTLAAPARLFRDPWKRYLWYKPSEPRVPGDPTWIPSDTKGGWISAGIDGVFGTADDVVPSVSR